MSSINCYKPISIAEYTEKIAVLQSGYVKYFRNKDEVPEGWELVQVVPAPGGGDQLVAYMKREIK